MLFAPGERAFDHSGPLTYEMTGLSTAPAEIRITVAIPTYNRADLLRQTLAGVTRQDFPAERYEVLVIDNNSRDGTRAVVAEFAGTNPAPRHLIETRQGLDHARNRALSEARGEIIVFADDDILVEADWLRELTAPLLADWEHKIGAVGGEVVPVFPDGLPPWVAEWHAPLAFRADAGPLPAYQTPMGANLAFPRRVFARVSTFAITLDRAGRNYFSGGDADMIRRVRAAGLEVWFAPAARARHQMPATRTTFRYAARHAFDSARSRVAGRVADLRVGHRPVAGYLASRLAGNLAKAAGFALLALLNVLVLRSGAAKQALVRAWRSCGYLYQIPRSALGRI
ncbi:MAG TPA: glycosyltransferase family 2 protein [Opitutaceae bacterium]|nr:glycosyltransferase family 2 protein [Opitutaceae bacterium]